MRNRKVSHKTEMLTGKIFSIVCCALLYYFSSLKCKSFGQDTDKRFNSFEEKLFKKKSKKSDEDFLKTILDEARKTWVRW